MKALLSLIISMALVVSGHAQTRNVLVGTNNAVVQPTNFWSADASNARSGLGLGSAATNPSSAFQPASPILSNLVSGGALTFSNVTVGISNVTGLQTALDGKLGTNPTLFIANISNLQTTLDGKLGTNPTLQISNIAALQTALDEKLSGTFPIAISNVSGLQSSLDGKLSTNPTLDIANIIGLQTNLDSKLSTTGNAANLTNFPTVALASNITGTAALASNVTGVVALTNGGTGATNASGARTAFGVGASDVFVGLTNLGSGGNLGFSSSPYILGSTNSTAPNNAVAALGVSTARDLIGALATNGNGAGVTNLTAANITGTVGLASNVTGTIAISNGGSGATTAGGVRTNLGLSWSALTNTNASTSLLGFTANGQVVANTTNALHFTNDNIAFNVGDLSLSNGTFFWGGQPRWAPEDNSFELPLAFNGTNTAATTRTNLGLGASNDVEFNTLQLGGSGQMSIRGTAGSIYFYNGVEVQNVLTIPADTDPVEINSQWNNAGVRSNLGLPLAALTNTSNVTMMRALGGSTNTNEPFSGLLTFIDDANGTNTITVSNGLILKLETQ